MAHVLVPSFLEPTRRLLRPREEFGRDELRSRSARLRQHARRRSSAWHLKCTRVGIVAIARASKGCSRRDRITPGPADPRRSTRTATPTAPPPSSRVRRLHHEIHLVVPHSRRGRVGARPLLRLANQRRLWRLQGQRGHRTGAALESTRAQSRRRGLVAIGQVATRGVQRLGEAARLLRVGEENHVEPRAAHVAHAVLHRANARVDILRVAVDAEKRRRERRVANRPRARSEPGVCVGAQIAIRRSRVEPRGDVEIRARVRVAKRRDAVHVRHEIDGRPIVALAGATFPLAVTTRRRLRRLLR